MDRRLVRAASFSSSQVVSQASFGVIPAMPEWGPNTSLQIPFARLSVAVSSNWTRREKPTTSAARIAARQRFVKCSPRLSESVEKQPSIFQI
jgi:hypothetical protein